MWIVDICTWPETLHPILQTTPDTSKFPKPTWSPKLRNPRPNLPRAKTATPLSDLSRVGAVVVGKEEEVVDVDFAALRAKVGSACRVVRPGLVPGISPTKHGVK